MPLAVVEKPDTRLVVAERRIEYPRLGKAYTRQAGEILYSARLVLTPDMNFYAVQESMPADVRMTGAAEELSMQLPYEIVGQIVERVKDKRDVIGKEASEIRQVLETYALTEHEKAAIQYVFDIENTLMIDPRKAKVFDDLFARGPTKQYIWQRTLTGLRVPAGLEAPKSYQEVIDGEIHEVYHFIVLEGDKEVGEALVPLGDGRIVKTWNEVHGIARTTTNENIPYGEHTTHWYVRLKPSVDPASGKRDVAVERRCSWLLGEHDRCLDVNADYWRSVSDLNDGFRPVQGSLVLPTAEEIGKVVGPYKKFNL